MKNTLSRILITVLFVVYVFGLVACGGGGGGEVPLPFRQGLL